MAQRSETQRIAFGAVGYRSGVQASPREGPVVQQLERFFQDIACSQEMLKISMSCYQRLFGTQNLTEVQWE